MVHLRAIARFSLMILYVPWGVGRFLLEAPFRPRRVRERETFLRWSRYCCRLLGIEITQHGQAPEPPFFLVSNHMSYLDIMVLGVCTGGRFIAKSEIGRWPLVGWSAGLVGTVFIDRRSLRDIPRVVELITSALDAGDGIIIFPEATSTDGSKVHSFKSPLLAPVAKSGFPVSYASLRYETRPGEPSARDAVCWFGSATLLDHFYRLCMLSGISAELRFGEETLKHTDRKELALQLEESVREIFVPVVGEAG